MPMNKTDLLINSAAAFIYDTFVISMSEATERARGYVSVVDAKGGNTETLSLVQLQEILTKALGDKYQWRDEKKRQQILQERQDRVDAYNARIEAGRKSPFKKW